MWCINGIVGARDSGRREDRGSWKAISFKEGEGCCTRKLSACKGNSNKVARKKSYVDKADQWKRKNSRVEGESRVKSLLLT